MLKQNVQIILISNFTIQHILTELLNNINFFRKQSKICVNNRSYFNLTPKSGYFEDLSFETKLSERSVNLSNFTILTNNHDVHAETCLNRSINVSKIVYSNATLCQDEMNQSYNQDYSNLSIIILCYVKKYEN